MSMSYLNPGPTRADLQALQGPAVLEFGTPWCGWCRAAQPSICAALAPHPEVRHLRIEDGPGRRLGRMFGIKLWPTLIFLKDGEEIGRVVRPRGADEIEAELRRIDPP
jgi:thioredoxin 1